MADATTGAVNLGDINYNNTKCEVNSSLSSSFVVDFLDGYSLRNVIALCQSYCLQNSVWIFHDHGISIISKTDDNTIVIPITIEKDKLTKYEFYSAEPLVITFEVSVLYKTLNKITKKDGVRIYKTQNSNIIFYQTGIKDSEQLIQSDCAELPTKPSVAILDFKIPEYTRRLDEDPNIIVPMSPNVIIDTKKLKLISTEFGNSEFKQTKFTFYEKGLHMAVVGQQQFLKKIGVVTQEPQNQSVQAMSMFDRSVTNVTNPNNIIAPTSIKDMTSTRVPVSIIINAVGSVDSYIFRHDIIKSFGLFENIAPRSVVQFYCKHGLPLKLVTNVGCYGIMSIYMTKQSN